MLILSKLKVLLGVTNLAGAATVVVGLVVALSAAAGWMREDAIKDCNAQWELKLAKANAELAKAVSLRDAQLTNLQEKLRLAQDAQAAAQVETSRVLELQREQIPLSEACMACRVPNEHLWVRPTTGNPAGGVERSSKAKGGGLAAKPSR